MSDICDGGSVESDSDTTIALGTWSGGDFGTTASQTPPVGANHDLPEVTRFVAGVAHLLRRRSAQLESLSESDKPDVAIFVLKPRPPDSASNAKRVPMVDNGRTRVVGRLWFASESVISARYITLPAEIDDDQRFNFVVDKHGLGAYPTLLFDARTVHDELRWYPKGLGEPDTRELLTLKDVVIPDEVFAAIGRIYRECLRTPGGLPSGISLWENASRHWPRSDAEALLQSCLKVGLVTRFPLCTILHEQPQAAGRTDLEIEQCDPTDSNKVTRHGVIELKVLRSFWSEGNQVADRDVARHIEKGVQQAAAYRQGKRFTWTALCCFDMRKTDVGDPATFGHVLEKADAEDVLLRRWFLYASASAYREAG